MANSIQVETPTLSLTQAVICLHLLEHPASAPSQRPAYPNCPVISSMELDLLSLQFEADPPFGSQCESHARLPIEIVFPPEVQYCSEGRTETLRCTNPVRPAEIVVTSTRFSRSGVRIWHVAIGPPDRGAFSEYDLIKLIHLYGGRSERTGIAASIHFRLPAKGDGKYSLQGLLHAACSEAPPQTELCGGAIQILSGDMRAGNTAHSELIETAAKASRADENDARERLTTSMSADGLESKALAAYCGIVTGILDFANMDASEVIDSLEPSLPDSALFTRFHRATLTQISDEDRIFTDCRDSVGISPYLILPHAALIHNDALIEEAEARIDGAIASVDASIPELESVLAEVDRTMHGHLIPNVFNYRSERSLFETGAIMRGSVDRREEVASKLKELHVLIEARWAARRDRGQMIIAILLAVMSLLQLKDPIFALLKADASPAAQWSLMIALCVGLSTAMAWLWQMGSRKARH